MLRRAAHWLTFALIAALFGFTGILRATADIAQSVCVVCVAFGVLSLLFSLFEEAATPEARHIRIKTRMRAPH